MPAPRLSRPFALWGLAASLAAPAAFAVATTAPRRPAKPAAKTASPRVGIPGEVVSLASTWERSHDLAAGKTVEVSVHLERPSTLPPNGRIAAEWVPPAGTPGGWRKVLHALDPDVYLVYRAPTAGKYALRLGVVTDEEPVGDEPRLREKGHAPELSPLPKLTPWPAKTTAPVRVTVQPVALGEAADEERLRAAVEVEPNDQPEQAQTLVLTPGEGSEVRTWEVTGLQDELEYFDNGKVGRAGDDWFRLDFRGQEPRLLTAQLAIPGQVIAARLRFYRLPGGDRRLEIRDSGKQPSVPQSPISNLQSPATPLTTHHSPLTLDLSEYSDGKDGNERAHQQDEEHRANIVRLLKPGDTYFLRVEANAPGYQLQLRLLQPPPYDDPRMAVRQGTYTHIGQVHAWLTNRPRGASIERRLRDSGNLLGTNCMSCHTQSGVWGPAVPFANGYRPENVQNYWQLVNIMYECLRPTNELKDAANNTSLATLDIGDGPAGTRAAGFNIVNAERILAPKKLHAVMQRRTANYVLQTSDPGGINAAGPGSNIGQVVVHLFAAEILKTAWEKTGEEKCFRELEEKARRVLAVRPKFTDDVALRLDFFGRVFPLKEYPAWAARMKTPTADAEKLVADAKQQLALDEARLRAIQKPDGSWGFNPGEPTADGKNWKATGSDSDPAPTALGITGLTSAGYGKDDPAIAKAVRALLAMQETSGRWNKAAQTGFVTTAYVLHALSRLYPGSDEAVKRDALQPVVGESLLATIRRIQAAALTGDPRFIDLLLAGAQHPSPLVRYWAIIGLGGTHTTHGVPLLVAALGDRAKPVREAATWALRQTLLDDKGWDAAFTAYERGDDTTRLHVLQALNMRADAVLSGASVDWARLGRLFDRAMNDDPHPAVRAWAAKAAWQWWVWNPPVRAAVNAAWVRMLERPEPNALVENSLRYSSHALFIANGHKANGSQKQQYPELEKLFAALSQRLDSAPAEAKERLVRRLVGIGGTFYTTSGGDGGPGQMGYVTPGAGEMMGKAALAYLEGAVKQGDPVAVKIGLEGAANVPYPPLVAFLVDYSLKGPEEMRQLAASSVSDARSVMLAAVPELVEPQLEQVRRGAMEPPRRAAVSDPILELWEKVNWIVPKTEEQQKAFFDLVIPRFDTYYSPQEIAKTTDPARRAEMEREMSAAWYLADRLGLVLERNPDLHQEIVFRRYFPARFRNPLEEHYWLRSVEWLVDFKTAPAAAGGNARKWGNEEMLGALPALPISSFPHFPISLQQSPAQADESLTIKDRALQLYLDQLKPEAEPRSRAIAIRMANKTALRKNPEVLRALARVLEFEKDEDLRKIIQNALKQGNDRFMPELLNLLKEEKHPSTRFGPDGHPVLTKAQTQDVLFFRDYVMPELTRQKRTDAMACMSCHGVPGRVPSLTLKAPDDFGYLDVAGLLTNYRLLQQRVDLQNLEKSKLLRKPLNVQDAMEDGHQGGRRYGPTDEGYLLLRRWVENQPAILKAEGGAAAAGR